MNKHSESNRRGRPVSADHSASLVSTLAENISGSYVGSGYYGTSVGSDDALDIASDLIDGPLSDTTVLVQIPEVRELVIELRCAYQGDTSGRKVMQPWFDALEVTS